MKISREQFPDQSSAATYEQILESVLPEDDTSRREVIDFLNNCPPLPKDPKEAFLIIRDYFVESGIHYDDAIFMPVDIIKTKKANCLGLTVLFGSLLEQRGLNPKFEVVVNPHDKRHERELREFDKLTHGDLFDYGNLPELPADKVEEPEYHFVPLEHPVIGMNGQKFETTSLGNGEESVPGDEIYDFKSESQRQVSLQNLVGSLLVSRAKILYSKLKKEGDLEPIVDIAKKGLTLWPEDRQGWLFLRDLAISQNNLELVKEAEEKFKKLSSNDSLYHFSMYELGEGEEFLDKSLEVYPAFIDAFVIKQVRLPFNSEAERKEARFNLTVAALCVANSIELDLNSFYDRYMDLFREAFGDENMDELLEDIDSSVQEA